MQKLRNIRLAEDPLPDRPSQLEIATRLATYQAVGNVMVVTNLATLLYVATTPDRPHRAETEPGARWARRTATPSPSVSPGRRSNLYLTS